MTAHVPIDLSQVGFDDEIAAFINHVTDIDQLRGPARNAALLSFARSEIFLGAGLMLEGLPGVIHREAWRALQRERERETPARAWSESWSVADRPVICRHLRIDHADPLALYATFPFRIIRPDGERPWIAAATGCPRVFDARSLSSWEHFDIHDVILWNPRSGEVRVAGDPGASLVECADYDGGRHVIYADGFAFFRAWADRRAMIGAGIMTARQSKHAIIPSEPADNGMPGTLVIGDLNKVHWRDLSATVLVAGPGIDPAALNRAVFRAARLPRVEAA